MCQTFVTLHPIAVVDTIPGGIAIIAFKKTTKAPFLCTKFLVRTLR